MEFPTDSCTIFAFFVACKGPYTLGSPITLADYGLRDILKQVFFIQDYLHPAWRVVLQKEPRSRRVVDNNDEQILGISGDLNGLQLPVDMNAATFRPNLLHAGEAVPAAEMARLNALVRGEGLQDAQHARAQRHPGRGRGRGRGGRRREG